MSASNSALILLVLLSLCLAGLGDLTTASELHGGQDCGGAGQAVDLPVILSTQSSITALQFDVQYPSAAVTPGTPVGGDAVVDHIVDSNVVADGVLRVLVYSPTQQLLTSGTVALIPFALATDVTASVQVSLPVGGGAYTGPGAILATLGAVSAPPDTDPNPGSIELVIVTDPLDATQCIGGSAAFDAGATGQGPTTYQWRKNGIPIPGATAASYTVVPVGTVDTGSYGAAITNACGQYLTDNAVLTVEGVCEPQDLGVYDTGTGGQLAAVWAPNPAAEVDDYRLYWGTDPGGPYTFLRDLPDISRTTLDGMQNGTRYYFRVTASADGVESPSSNEANAVPTGGALVLPQARDYGYQTTPNADLSHPDLVTYRFPPRRGDVTIWYDAYDVDYAGEVTVTINGREVATLAVTNPSSWSGLKRVTLPDSLVFDDQANVLTFDSASYPPMEESWGVRMVSIQLPAPVVSTQAWSQTVDLTLNQAPEEPTLASFDIHREMMPGVIPASGNRIASVSPETIYRDDAGLLNEQMYYYVVRSIDTIGNRGVNSVELSALPTDAETTPVAKYATVKSGNDIVLSWPPVTTEAGIAYYNIYDGSSPASMTLVGQSPTPSFVLENLLSDGLDHFFEIRTVDSTGRESVE